MLKRSLFVVKSKVSLDFSAMNNHSSPLLLMHAHSCPSRTWRHPFRVKYTVIMRLLDSISEVVWRPSVLSWLSVKLMPFQYTIIDHNTVVFLSKD